MAMKLRAKAPVSPEAIAAYQTKLLSAWQQLDAAQIAELVTAAMAGGVDDKQAGAFRAKLEETIRTNSSIAGQFRNHVADAVNGTVTLIDEKTIAQRLADPNSRFDAYLQPAIDAAQAHAS